MLRSLEDDAWSTRPTAQAWDIRAMYQHVLGACEAGASMRENVHQLRRGRAYRKQHGGPLEAALSVSSGQRAGRPQPGPGDRATDGGRTEDGSRTQTHASGHPQSAKMAVDGPVHETWKLGYLIDTIYLRDLWMHRVDVAHALGQPLEFSADHDGRIVADVVAEWARRHGQPFVLELTGPVWRDLCE